jgi:hypothetical protein
MDSSLIMWNRGAGFISTCLEFGNGEGLGKENAAEVCPLVPAEGKLVPCSNRGGTVTEATAFVER